MQEESYSFCCSLYIYLERENLRFSNIVWLTLALTDSCVKCLVTNDMSSSLRKSGSLWITERFISESILTWLSAHCSAVFQFVICTWWSSTFKHFGYPWCEWYKSILDLNLKLTVFSALLLYNMRPLDHFTFSHSPSSNVIMFSMFISCIFMSLTVVSLPLSSNAYALKVHLQIYVVAQVLCPIFSFLIWFSSQNTIF